MRVSILIALLLACSGMSMAQSSAVAFEVASIKLQPWTNEGGAGVRVQGNTLYGEHADLYALVNFAYGLREDNLQLSGGPDWARHGILSNISGFDSTLYEVTAKAAEGTTPSVDEFRSMLRSLLAERFRLQVHHASKELPVFNLVVVKDGVRFRENSTDAKKSVSYHDGRAFRITAVHAPLADLVAELAYATGRPVVDKTGLGGFYDFDVAWSPRFSRNDLASDDQAEDRYAGADVASPGVFTAIQQQLGLKMSTGTAPFDTVVIDHAEKPTAN